MTPMVTTRNPPPVGDRTIPATVDRVAFGAALAPVLALLGLDYTEVLADGITITDTAIECWTVAPLAGVAPVEMCASGEESGIWAWPVSVEVVLT